jgi:hypothetical protein
MRWIAMRSRTIGFLTFLLAALAGCEEDTPTSCDGCGGSASWRQLAGGLGESRFVAVWADAPDTIIALGADHPAYRFDGAAWSALTLPDDDASFLSMWAASPRDIFAVGLNGLAMHFDGATWTSLASGSTVDFTDVWGVSANELIVVGTDFDGGHVLRYAGGVWTELPDTLATPPRAVWATGARNILVAGDGGYVERYDGRFWTPVRAADGLVTWMDAWPASTNSVYFAGTGGWVGHYAGSVFTTTPTPTQESLYGVFGYSDTDVWAVGDGGAIVHFDGAGWTLAESGTTADLRDVWGWDGGAIAVGFNGTVVLYDGTSWHTPFDGRATAYHDMFGFSEDEVFAVGRIGVSTGFVRHLDGREWTLPTEELLSVWGFAPDDVYVTGRLGEVHHFDGASWSPLTTGTLSHLTGISGARASEATRIYVVGERATIRVFDGSTWTPMVPPSSYVLDLRDVWAAAPDDVFAVGGSGSVLRFRGPLGTIIWEEEPTGLVGAGFNAITGRRADDVFAVSGNGRIFRYNGLLWTEIPTTVSAPLVDVSLTERRAGAVVADPHTLLLLSGRTTSPLEIPFLGTIETAWMTGGTVFVAGRQGAWFVYGESP